MKLITYNVNGIRAVLKKGFLEWLKIINPDVVCLQEVKAEIDQIDVQIFRELGYNVFWHSAIKKGYSGVAILTKLDPSSFKVGMDNDLYDSEGRVLRIDLDDYSVMSVYFPSGSSGDDRQTFKYKWLEDFNSYIHELRKTKPNLIICGDYNICHKPIDIHNPVSNKNSSGFLPEEREWMENFINSGFTDTFRFFHQDPHHYTWWSYRGAAREKNLGWRIDYVLSTNNLDSKLKKSKILKDVKFSDHCPVLMEIN